jgi:putative flippase GtrA
MPTLEERRNWRGIGMAAWNWQLARYIVVGVFNTGFGYLIYSAGLFLGLDYYWANLAALLLTLPLSFRTQGRLVFGNHSLRPFLRYLLCWVAVYLFNIGLIALLLAFGLDAYVAGALAVPPVVGLGFLLQKYLVFLPSVGNCETTSRTQP